MSRSFSGVWGTFEHLDDFCDVVKALRKRGQDNLTTHAPCSRSEIDRALGSPQSRVPFAALGGGIAGFLSAVWMIVHMTSDWALPVSAKPIVSIPIMIPVAFELSVLTAIFCTIFAILYCIVRDTRRTRRPESRAYKSYNRFMRDRFGVVVPCDPSALAETKKLLKRHHAEEVHVEK